MDTRSASLIERSKQLAAREDRLDVAFEFACHLFAWLVAAEMRRHYVMVREIGRDPTVGYPVLVFEPRPGRGPSEASR